MGPKIGKQLNAAIIFENILSKLGQQIVHLQALFGLFENLEVE